MSYNTVINKKNYVRFFNHYSLKNSILYTILFAIYLTALLFLFSLGFDFDYHFSTSFINLLIILVFSFIINFFSNYMITLYDDKITINKFITKHSLLWKDVVDIGIGNINMYKKPFTKCIYLSKVKLNHKDKSNLNKSKQKKDILFFIASPERLNTINNYVDKTQVDKDSFEIVISNYNYIILSKREHDEISV